MHGPSQDKKFIPVQLVRILVHQQFLVDDGLVGRRVDHLGVVSPVQPLADTKYLFTRKVMTC